MTGRALTARLLALMMALFVLACASAGPTGQGNNTPATGISPTALTTEAIVAQPLDAAPAPEMAVAVAEVPVKDSDPQVLDPLLTAKPSDSQTALIPEAEPKPPSSPEEVACVKKGGLWIHAGKSIAFTCVKITRDSGKQCRKGSECQGSCLARSMTCAPYDPLFGCNDILQDDGSRVTLCID